MELFEKCYDFTRAKMAKAMGYYPFFIPFDDSEGTEVIVDGQRKIMIGSNNYLGLTMHPKVREAAMNAVKRFGPSCTGSRFMNGTLKIHEDLEQRLAAFVGKEAALVFSTGMQTNLGTISALIGRGDIAITDKDDHASIIDGCRLSYGEMKRFRHNDLESLDVVLKSCPEDAGKLVIVATHEGRVPFTQRIQVERLSKADLKTRRTGIAEEAEIWAQDATSAPGQEELLAGVEGELKGKKLKLEGQVLQVTTSQGKTHVVVALAADPGNRRPVQVDTVGVVDVLPGERALVYGRLVGKGKYKASEEAPETELPVLEAEYLLGG